ncbi:hypothetical protein HBH47_081270 [Parastagonospora nodorum]|nr:hypothetical protein HBH47_081270 [Parastagonospora nodorum]KAH5250441.1 hypothetical protein HBI71_161850 [Parastagonospora nodorum]KAH5385316.1 hypothetical protein HBI33_086150 [Parastagonospora nodorum]KAH6297172.1 hypothetical protein HBI39_152610 [Parastagonospora nodorum]
MDVDTTPDLEAGVRTDVDASSDHITSETQAQVMSPADRPESPSYPYHEQMKNLYWRSRSHDDLGMLLFYADRHMGMPGPNFDLPFPLRDRRDDPPWVKTKTNLTIVEHMVNAKPTFTPVDKVEDLAIALATESRASEILHGNDQLIMRLYIVEDLSIDVIELLGSRYNIDPLFFSTQYDYWDYREGGSSEPLRLQLSKKHRKWFHIDNVRMCRDKHRPFMWESNDNKTSKFNVERHIERQRATQGQDDILILNTRTAFWLDKDGEGGPLVGIVLVDPTNSLFGGDYRDKSIPRPTTTSESEQVPTASESEQETWYSDIVEISSRFLGNPPFPPGTAINLMAVVYPATVAVCAEWLKVCHFYSVVLDKIESVFVSSSDSGPERNEIDEALEILPRLSKNLPNWRRMVIAALEDAIPAATRLSKPASHSQDKQNDLLLDQIGPDLKRIKCNIEELQNRSTRLTDRCVAEMQLQAARESLAESHNLARLSWLATIFVPLTFLSGLFSMSEDIGSLRLSCKYYFSIGLPLVTVALVVVRWGPNIAHKMDRWFWSAVTFFLDFCFRWRYLYFAVLNHRRSKSIWTWITRRRRKYL